MVQKAGQNPAQNEDKLNRMTPGASEAELGSRLAALIESHNALLAKLDADATVTDTDFAATLAVPSLDEPLS
ncbi:MAG TPA: hypothetical protein VFL54_10005 [Gammaproteobacteria bacterium]|nr:hypothetical protein [Gammaproteobacteria bacterium]